MLQTIGKWILIILFFPLSLIFLAYFKQKKAKDALYQRTKSERQEEDLLPLHQHPEISAIFKNLEESLLGPIESEGIEYNHQDVKNCLSIMSNFLTKMDSTNSESQIRKVVKESVKSLNKLDGKCNGHLIKTPQREDLTDIIIIAGSINGYNARNEDITEEWRKW